MKLSPDWCLDTLAALACVDFTAIADKPAAAAMLAPPIRTLRREEAGSFFLFMGFLRIEVNLDLHFLRVAPRQEAENVRRDLRLVPRRGELRARHHVLGQRDDLLAYENAEQPNQRHHGRRWRAHVEQAVDDADQEAGAER